MDQRLVVDTALEPGMGHNQGPDTAEPVSCLKHRLATVYHGLVSRFADLEQACRRVPDLIVDDEEARLVTDFVAQCQAHVQEAEAAHKLEKAVFLQGGRTVDGFFKRRCEQLNEALIPVLSRLKTYRDRCQAEMATRRQALVVAAENETVRALDYRAQAERLSNSEEQANRQRAAAFRALADASTESAEAMIREAEACLEPVRIQGEYGATAYITRSWVFEVIDLSAVPRHYLTLNAEKLRAAIVTEGVRDIPGAKVFQKEELRVRGVA